MKKKMFVTIKHCLKEGGIWMSDIFPQQDGIVYHVWQKILIDECCDISSW